MTNDTIKIGDFIANYDEKNECYTDVKYDGATGPGSVAVIKTIPVELCCDALSGLYVEKVIVDSPYCRLSDMPKLREIEIAEFKDIQLSNLPALESITVTGSAEKLINLHDEFNHVKRIYLKDIQAPKNQYENNYERGVAGDGIHAIFGDEVTSVRVIEGGHITLGRNVKSIAALNAARMGIDCGSAVPDYELPTRIDFLSPLPPTIGKLRRDGIFNCELHVPTGALDAYSSHRQWKFAAVIIDEDGKTIDNYAERHRLRMEQRARQLAIKQEKEAKEAKEEKIEAMGKMVHPMQLKTRLAKWHPELQDGCSDLSFFVTVNQIKYKFDMPYTSPLSIWDDIVARLEMLESIH